MPDRKPYLFAVLGLLTLLLFGRVVTFDLLFWDDHVNVVQNKIIQQGLTSFEGIFQTARNLRIMPVSWIAYKTVYQIAGVNAAAFHAANLMLHIANTLLFAWLVLIVIRRRAYKHGASANVVALMAVGIAALWAWHPLRVEPTAWVTALTYHCATIFFLLHMLALVKRNDALQSGASLVKKGKSLAVNHDVLV